MEGGDGIGVEVVVWVVERVVRVVGVWVDVRAELVVRVVDGD